VLAQGQFVARAHEELLTSVTAEQEFLLGVFGLTTPINSLAPAEVCRVTRPGRRADERPPHLLY
jgi:hypothetical protein